MARWLTIIKIVGLKTTGPKHLEAQNVECCVAWLGRGSFSTSEIITMSKMEAFSILENPTIHPGELTWNPKHWRFGRWIFLFQFRNKHTHTKNMLKSTKWTQTPRKMMGEITPRVKKSQANRSKPMNFQPFKGDPMSVDFYHDRF